MRKAEAARYLGISVRQLTEMMKRNVVPFAKISHRICLFKSEDLDRAISRFRVEVHGE
jgi:excisionase family DNA binding protein